MKKFALSTAALLALVSPFAHAQSSVTLYGIIDAGVTYFSNLNGHSAFVANDGSIQSNRWGLRGIEDIGGGSRVIFDLENGFNLYSGTMVHSAGLRSASSTTSSGTISRSLQWARAPVSTRGIPATSIT
jgi:predicted porin